MADNPQPVADRLQPIPSFISAIQVARWHKDSYELSDSVIQLSREDYDTYSWPWIQNIYRRHVGGLKATHEIFPVTKFGSLLDDIQLIY